MNYVPEPDKIEAGVKILAEEIERAGVKADGYSGHHAGRNDVQKG